MKAFMQRLLSPQPKLCLLCRKRQSWNSIQPLSLCRECYEHIPWIGEIKCGTCGRAEACIDCRKRKPCYFVCSRSAVRYSQTMKQWLAQYKYRGDESIEPLFTAMLDFAYRQLQKSEAFPQSGKTVIAYVPISGERREIRSFNQAKRMAQGIGTLRRLPVLDLLERNKDTEKQSFYSRRERISNVENIFSIKSEGLEVIKQILQTEAVKVILVDDIFTTGSTMNQCAQVISRHANVPVFGLTWAR